MTHAELCSEFKKHQNGEKDNLFGGLEPCIPCLSGSYTTIILERASNIRLMIRGEHSDHKNRELKKCYEILTQISFSNHGALSQKGAIESTGFALLLWNLQSSICRFKVPASVWTHVFDRKNFNEWAMITIEIRKCWHSFFKTTYEELGYC